MIQFCLEVWFHVCMQACILLGNQQQRCGLSYRGEYNRWDLIFFLKTLSLANMAQSHCRYSLSFFHFEVVITSIFCWSLLILWYISLRFWMYTCVWLGWPKLYTWLEILISLLKFTYRLLPSVDYQCQSVEIYFFIVLHSLFHGSKSS